MYALTAAMIQLAYTSSKNLVNFGPVFPEIMRLECAQQAS